jgi:hypothetical protein
LPLRHGICNYTGCDYEITVKEKRNMKNIKQIMALSAALLLIFAVSSALAQSDSSAQIQKRQGFVDANGDGICDITGRIIGSGLGTGQGQQARRGNQNGPGDGTGNQGSGPKDGTGYGSQTGKKLGPRDGSQARIGWSGWSGTSGISTGARIRKGGRR